MPNSEPVAPAHASLALRFLREVEEGLLAALDWLPYADDVPEESQAALAAAVEKHGRALDDVREARQSVEFEVLNEATQDETAVVRNAIHSFQSRGVTSNGGTHIALRCHA